MKEKHKTYEKLRQLALRDAKRRLVYVKDKIPEWKIVNKIHENGEVEKIFSYNPSIELLLSIDLNTYANIREIKYIVWRLDISDEELRGE